MRTSEEERVLKALEAFENGTLAKGGDALQNAPHDGGFATQGTNIQSKAKAVKKAMKALIKGGMSETDAAKIVKAIESNDDDDSSSDNVDDDTSSPMPMAKSVDADDDDSASDDESDDEEIEKSHRRGASQLSNASSRGKNSIGGLRKALIEDDAANSAAIDAAPILAKLIDAIDNLSRVDSRNITKSLQKNSGMDDLRKSVQEGRQQQAVFQSQLAKAMPLLFSKMSAVEDMVKAIHDQPVANYGGNTLRKSDIREPSFNDGDTSGFDGSPRQSPLANVEFLKIQEALVDMCKSNHVDLLDVTRFENSRNYDQLPSSVIKRLEAKLCSAE